MVEDWNADDYHDVYEEQLTAAIEAKAAGKPIEVDEVEDAPTADDIEALLAALQASQKAKAAKVPAKKAAAKKAPVKREKVA